MATSVAKLFALTMDSSFANRLRKNFKHFRKGFAQQGLTAYRVYDRDLPEYPYVVEWYAGRIQLVEFPRRRATQATAARRAEVWEAVRDVLEVSPENIYPKTHEPKPWGRAQYGREDSANDFFSVLENGLTFWVNLKDHLDSGLFLDHRRTRAQVRREALGKRFLNLYAYTGSFTVAAGVGGASDTTTVDLSNTYLEWAERNLVSNGLAGPKHTLVRADVMAWLGGADGEAFDLIVLDPPSFSTSKAMRGTFNIQRDQTRLLERALHLLAPGGTLYFSTNFRGFDLEATGLDATFEELTPGSIPEDFHDRAIHRCWRVRAAPARQT